MSIPDFSSGRVKLPASVFMRSPNTGTEAFPARAKVSIGPASSSATSLSNAGCRWTSSANRLRRDPTDGGYADLNMNYGEPGGGNAARKYFASAGTTDINDWAARTKSRYNGLQVAINRPFKSGLMLKGAYT